MKLTPAQDEVLRTLGAGHTLHAADSSRRRLSLWWGFAARSPTHITVNRLLEHGLIEITELPPTGRGFNRLYRVALTEAGRSYLGERR